jgi:hypothetical protein
VSVTRAKDDHRRRLLASDPRQLACTVADFGTAIGAAFEAVLAGDPLEQPLTPLLRLHTTDAQAAVGSAVAVIDMRQYEPQSEAFAQTARHGYRFCGTGGLVNSTQDGLHHPLPEKVWVSPASANSRRDAIGGSAHPPHGLAGLGPHGLSMVRSAATASIARLTLRRGLLP